MMVTIFKNIFSKEPHQITIEDALKRISDGKSRVLCEKIRETIDKEKSQKLKANLPSICFSGTFEEDRKDSDLIEHSGYICLDFDSVEDLRNKQNEIINQKFVYACWVSPSGKGLKALVKIADGSRHREHFQALQDVFPEIDRSGINVSRVCYESYDHDIYINENATVFNKIKKIEKIYVKETTVDDEKVFKNLLSWLSNRKDAFVTGERNSFIFKLASACCRFGINEMTASAFINNEFLSNTDFTAGEADRAIRSAYKSSKAKYGSACFDKEILIDKVTKKEIEIDATIYDESIRPKDVIYGIDVKEQALDIYDKGYEQLYGIRVLEFDTHFKPKRGELTLLTGYGNAGKSTLKKWYQVMRILLYNEKFATFSPEDNPPEEYYHDFVEVLLGCDCTPSNPLRPNRETYEKAYDWISQHVFYMYPKETQATPEYIKERFLELIIKEKVDGVDIDPFNRMANNYKDFFGRDKYLEYTLADFARFAQINNVYFWIIAHPKTAVKDGTGNYPCPDVFDVHDGSMWNNMTDNILVYHRPLAQSDPQNPMCEFHSKKIRRQKSVGKKGFIMFEMLFKKRRFFFSGADPLENALYDKEISFKTTSSLPTSVINIRSPYNDGVINDFDELPF